MSSSIITKVVQQMESFPDNMQRQVWEFVLSLKTSVQLQHGIPGKQLLRFAGIIPRDDLELMRQAIETGCGQVDLNEW